MFERLWYKQEEANGSAGSGGGTNGGGSAGAGGQAGAGAVQSTNIGTSAAGGGTPAAANTTGAGGSSGVGAGGAGGGNAASWLDSLPDDLKKDPSLAMFKDTSSLAKSWVNAQKMIGADKVVIPGEKAGEEEWNQFYQKLGRPESADKYEFKLPDGVKLDEARAKEAKDIAFKAGLSGRQLQELVAWDAARQTKAMQDAQASEGRVIADSLEKYKTEVGGEDKFRAQVDKARVAVRELADDKFRNFLVESQLGSRPEAIEFFAKLYPMLEEGKIRGGSGAPITSGAEDPADIQMKISDIETKIFSNMGSPDRQTWVEQRAKLYERLSLAQARSR